MFFFNLVSTVGSSMSNMPNPTGSVVSQFQIR
jgi:hypothetical protein